MKIAFDSELMENQKHAVVMAPDLAFEALQSQDGDALFFSIGTDRVFYLTREVTQTSTGWTKLDLSSALSSQHGGAAVAAKAFQVAQNAQTLAIDLALVLTVGGADFLYLSLGNANSDAAWANGVTWTAIPFDAGTAPAPLTIADVLAMNLPVAGGDGAVENIFVDILRSPGDPFHLLDRYYIVPGGAPQWRLHKLAADLAAGSISSCLGQRTSDPVPGIYTFGQIASTQELLFTPQYNYFRPTSPPSPARLTVPAGTSAIASALDGTGVSNLFVAATGGLFLFTPDNQHDQATPVQISTNTLIAGASSLAAATAAGRTAVWGVDPQGALFYLVCPAGSEADPGAWSNPVPLLPSVEGFAFFLNLDAGNSVLFAHVDGQDLVQLTQDPVTTDWVQRGILLPSTSPDDVVVYNSYTTHIQITDDSGIGAPNIGVAVTATSPVSVYLNDAYHLLSPTVAVSTTADATGVLTLVQETQSLAGVCFQIVLADGSGVTAEINPMTRAMAILGKIQDGDDLAAVQVPNADGTRRSLVPASVTSSDRDAAAASLAQLVKINAGLPQNGARQGAGGAARRASAAPTVPRTWGVSFANGGWTYHEGDGTARGLGLCTVPVGPALAAGVGTGAALEGIAADFEVAAGDLFHWLADSFDQVESFVVQEVDGLYHFLATLGGKVYDALLDCWDAVVHAVEFVCNRIGVFFKDLIAWLGFLFQWGDILRTHCVLKNVLAQSMARCIDSLGSARAALQDAFTSVQGYIDAWAGIPDNIPPSLSGTSLNSAARSAAPVPGQASPQSNWALHHLKSNAVNGSTTAQPNVGVTGDIAAVLKPLLDALEREQEVFQAAFTSFKIDIIDKIRELSFVQVLKAVIAIIADALLQSIENVLLAAIDVLTALVAGVLDGVTATIEIPILSWLYRKIAGDDLSLLDLGCLIAAIPITLGYKSIASAAPFPDNATTTALIDAPDFATIQKICNADPAAAAVGIADALVRTEATASISTPLNKTLVLTGGIASLVGSVVLSIFQPLKQKKPEIKPFSVINGVAYLLYVSPDFMGQIPDLQNKKWWAITNTTISSLMVVKAMVDMGVGLTAQDSRAQSVWNPASPWIDFVGNILWEVPTVAAVSDPENYNKIGYLNYWAGTCFDCNGMMSPAVADDSDPESWAVAVGIATVCNLAYGAMSCAASALTFES